MANTHFNPSNFDFYKSEQNRLKNQALIPEFTKREKIFSIGLYCTAFVISIAFFIVSLIYILSNPNFHYDQGGIGIQGIIAVCTFFTSLIETIVISFLYHHKLKNSNNAKLFNRIRIISSYLFLYFFIFLLSSIAFRIDVCVNASVNVWGWYGYFIIILATVIISAFIKLATMDQKEKRLRNISIALLLLTIIFTISNYYILQSSVVIDKYNMWTIILGTISILAGIIILYSGEKKNYAFSFFQLFVFLGFTFYAIGLLYYGCSMLFSIPHLI